MAFFAAWGLIESAFFLIFILALALGTSFDRRGREAPKWWILLIFFVCYIIYRGRGFEGFTKDFWLSWDTWRSFGDYVVLGLIYSVVECVVEVLTTQKVAREKWASFLLCNSEVKAHIKEPVSQAPGDSHYKQPYYTVASQLDSYCSLLSNDHRIVKFTVGVTETDGKKTLGLPEPHINRSALVDNLFAWVILWPGYAVSLVFGRVLDLLIETLSKLFEFIGTGFVRRVFRNTFTNN